MRIYMFLSFLFDIKFILFYEIVFELNCKIVNCIIIMLYYHVSKFYMNTVNIF